MAVAGAGAVGGVTPAPAGRQPNLADLRTSPAVTAALAQAINAKLAGTPMAGTGPTFVSAGNANGVSPWFLVAIAGVESEWGRTGFATNGSHNPFGMGVTGAPGAGIRYPSWDAAIRGAAANLGGPLYRGAGKVTIAAIGARWAADPRWADKVAAMMARLTGSRVLTTEVVIGGGRELPQPDPSTSPLDVAGNLAGDALGGLVGLLGRVFSVGTALRILSALGGLVLLALAVVFLFRSRGR